VSTKPGSDHEGLTIQEVVQKIQRNTKEILIWNQKAGMMIYGWVIALFMLFVV